jgi:hypothetical protein
MALLIWGDLLPLKGIAIKVRTTLIVVLVTFGVIVEYRYAFVIL